MVAAGWCSSIRTMRYLLIVLAASLIDVSVLADEVYRWVDENGRVHFSDQPRDKTESTKDTTHDWVDVRGNRTYSDRSREQIKAERRRFIRKLECMNGLTEVIELPNSQSRTRVVLLTARWCSLSKQARAWLKKNKVAFKEYDIDRSRLGRSLYLGLARKGVPAILVGQKQMFGFRADLAETLFRENGQLAGQRKNR
jgi:glutaredoxin